MNVISKQFSVKRRWVELEGKRHILTELFKDKHCVPSPKSHRYQGSIYPDTAQKIFQPNGAVARRTVTRTSGGFMGTSCLLENLVTSCSNRKCAKSGSLTPRLACHLRSARGWRCCVPQPLHLQLQTHLYSYSLQGCQLHFARWLGEVHVINGKSVPCCDFLESVQYFFSVWSALWHWDISPDFLASIEPQPWGTWGLRSKITGLHSSEHVQVKRPGLWPV